MKLNLFIKLKTSSIDIKLQQKNVKCSAHIYEFLHLTGEASPNLLVMLV